MGLHEIKKLMLNIRNGHQIEETTHRVGKNIYWLYIIQWTDDQYIQGTQKIKLPQN
jgi:hypothetical protein